MPRPSSSPHGTPNRWRTGCQCKLCYDAHLDDLASWRARRLRRRFPRPARDTALQLLAAGASTTAAAEAVGLSPQTLHAYAWSYPVWGEKMDDALMQGRDPDVPHGTTQGYRWRKCRCPECREAHHPSSEPSSS